MGVKLGLAHNGIDIGLDFRSAEGDNCNWGQEENYTFWNFVICTVYQMVYG
jgi:hypothetical protein